ncbi:MAG: alpha/beta fold hydrolase [Polyangiales bacterium]
MRRWKGLKALVHDAVDHTTRLIEEGHESVARVAMAVLDQVEPVKDVAHTVDDARRVVTSGVLASVRAVNRAVQVASDAVIDVAAQAASVDAERVEGPIELRSDRMKSLAWVGDAALGAINGVVGDTLEASSNGLDLGMALRSKSRFIDTASAESVRDALENPSGKIAIFVHGLCTTEWSWCLEAEQYHGAPDVNFGVLLERDEEFVPIFARYNTGRHISQNGRALAEQIEALVSRWPVAVTDIALIGHSMGGLVSRSATHFADREGKQWRTKLTHVVSLGSPHHGAPLEKIGNVLTSALLAIDWPATKIPGRILQGRSAGIKDLRYGYVLDEDWLGRDPDALLENNQSETAPLDGVAYCFISATMTQDPEHPVGKIVGDLLVRVPSAEAERIRERSFEIETARFGGVMHHELQNHPDVYAQVRAFVRS